MDEDLEGIIAISSDDRWAHVYADEANAAAHGDFAPFSDGGSLDFYDLTGRPLRAAFTSKGRLAGVERADDSADPELVQARLHRVLLLIRPVLRRRASSLSEHLTERGITLDQALVELPPLEGASLGETVRRYRTFLGPHAVGDLAEHRGSIWHNLFVHGF